jgi:hypothetical protein
LKFAVSHPFARTKAKGWGTVLVQNQTAKDLGGNVWQYGFAQNNRSHDIEN